MGIHENIIFCKVFRMAAHPVEEQVIQCPFCRCTHTIALDKHCVCQYQRRKILRELFAQVFLSA